VTRSTSSAARRRRALALAGLLALAALAVVLLLLRGDPTDADRRGAEVTTVEIESEAVGRTQPVAVVVPPRAPARDRPGLVFLHGRGGDEASELDDAFFAALASAGRRAPVVAFPDGGDSSYWHDRASGSWGTYVTGEVIPELVRRFDVDPDRLAIGGISMGGYGAYDLARLNPGMFCAVGGHSPALWASADETAEGAFDDAEDFARHDVIAAARTAPDPFRRVRLWLDIGEEDPFAPGADAFLAALAANGIKVVAKRWPGGHDDAYWDRHWDDYMRFYSEALASAVEAREAASIHRCHRGGGPREPVASRGGVALAAQLSEPARSQM